jgi:hypothetical protein
MQNNQDKIKKLAGSLLSQFEAEPPLDMWSRIELKTRRKKRLILFRYLTMAASVLILLGVGFSLLMPDRGPDVQSGRTQVAVTEEESELTGSQGMASDKYPNSVIRPSVSDIQPEKNSLKRESVNQSSESIKSGESSANEATPDPRLTSEKPEDKIVNEIFSSEMNLNNLATDSIELAEVMTPPVVSEDKLSFDLLQSGSVDPPVTDEPGNNKWQLAFGYGTSAAIEMSNEESALNSPESNYSYDGLTAEVANETSYFEEIESISHDAPLSLGFIVSKQFGKRWYAETGLLYTRLGYRVKTYEMNNIYQQYSNELYYLGIPLGIRFAVLERKHFGVFAAQSIIIEKGINSQSYTDTYTQGVLSGSENNEAGIRGVQLSSLTGMGADVKIAGNLAAYGQAGVQLFFLNSTQPYNIRSARMAWPSFQVGLRMKLD